MRSLILPLALGGCFLNPFIDDATRNAHEASVDSATESSPDGEDSTADEDSESPGDDSPGDSTADSDADSDPASDTDLPDKVDCFVDADGDGFAASNATAPLVVVEAGDACPSGTSSVRGDCEDTNRDVHPAMFDVCDGVDTNCSSDPVCTRNLSVDGDVAGVVSVYALRDSLGERVVGGYLNGDVVGDIAVGAEHSSSPPVHSWNWMERPEPGRLGELELTAVNLVGLLDVELLSSASSERFVGASVWTTAESVAVFPSWDAGANWTSSPTPPSWDVVTEEIGGTPEVVGPVAFIPQSDAEPMLAMALGRDVAAKSDRVVVVASKISIDGVSYAGWHAAVEPDDSFDDASFGLALAALRTPSGVRLMISGTSAGKGTISAVSIDDLSALSAPREAEPFVQGPSPAFGSLLVPCDIDGDGWDELITLGSPDAATGTTNLFVLPSPAEGEAIGDVESDALVQLAVPGRLGAPPPGVACVDVDDNGAGDLLVARGAGDWADAPSGVAWAFLGRVGWFPPDTDARRWTVDTARAEWRGTLTHPLGGAISGVPDRNGDRYPEVVLGMPAYVNVAEASETVGGIAVVYGRSFQ